MRPVHLWLGGVVIMVVGFFALAMSPISSESSNVALFWFTIVITLLCAAFAIGLMVVAHRVRQAELGIIAAGLYAASMFPFVHGLYLPGVLVSEETGATSFAAWVALPAALIVIVPAVTDMPGRAALLRNWELVTGLALAITTVLAVALILAPEAVPSATPGTGWTLAGAAIGFCGAQLLAYRQMRLFEVGRRLPSALAAIGFSWLGMSGLMWLVDGPSLVVVWVAHVLDGLGVLGAAAGVALAHRNDRRLTDIFEPIINRDPAVAVRLGVTPQVTHFVASIDEKDHNTAGHVTRVAELALRLGERAGFTGQRLRDLGLGALLHDVGKVDVPDEILTKPGKLSDAEFDQMKQHTVRGEELLAPDELLAPVAKLVRSHHERVDGRGYPDGLAGEEIPLDVGIISVVDAWDAMVHTRHYRRGMAEDEARAIFTENVGAQWSEMAVALLMATLDEDAGLAGLFADLLADGQNPCCSDVLDDVIGPARRIDDVDLPGVRRVATSA